MNFAKWICWLTVALILPFCSCKDDDVKIGSSYNGPVKGVNDVEMNGVQVSADATEATFSVYSMERPVIKSDQNWISGEASEPSKINGISKISLILEPNTTTEERAANITVSATGTRTETSSIVVKITQSASPSSNPEKPEDPQDPEEQDPDDLEDLLGLKAMDIAKDIIAGWNIGNTLEAIGGETAWGNPMINDAYIDGIKAAGFNAVRIPCSWDQNIADKSTNTIKPEWLDRVDEVVGMVISRGMYAIVNIHWDGGWLENNIGTDVKDNLLEKQKTLWTQIANKLGHYNEKLLFAGLNEPNADEEAGAKALLQYEQAFIDAVRATGGNNATRTLIFQGPNTDINKTYENFKTNPSDPAGEGYLMAEIHYYDPYQYTIMEKDESWGKIFWFWGSQFHQPGHARNASWGEEDWMKAQFDKMKSQFVDKKIPVIVGEYGAYPQEDKHYASQQTDEEKEIVAQSRAYFYNCVQRFAKERGLIPFVWDTGELIKRTDGSITKQYMIDAIIEGASSVSYPY